MSDTDLEIEMDCTRCGRYSTSAICPACAPAAGRTSHDAAAERAVADQGAATQPTTPTDALIDRGIAADVAALRIVTAEASANAAVQGAGSRAGGQLLSVGYPTAAGYITAIRNGVVARTHALYIETLRGRFGMTSGEIAALNLRGPMTSSDLPTSVNPTVHTPTGPSVFDRPRSERAFVVGPTANEAEAAPVVVFKNGTMIAGAVAEGHGVLVGWSGKGKLTRGALVEAIAAHDVKPPAATSARAQAGRVMSALTGLGYVVRIARAGTVAANGTMWTIGKVNHKSLVGSELGSVEMRVTLQADGQLVTEGHAALGAKVAADYAALVADEIYQAGDVTGWLAGVLAGRYDAVRFGVGFYVPAKHAAAAGALCEAVSKIWGTDWIVPALPVATSDQLRDGIVRGLQTEVAELMHRLDTERETARIAKKEALDAAMALTDWRDAHARAIKLAGDIGPTRAATFLKDLRAIGARIVAYGQVLGEERLASAKTAVRDAVASLEAVLGDDYSGISARFAGVWDEIEMDRKRAGGVL